MDSRAGAKEADTKLPGQKEELITQSRTLADAILNQYGEDITAKKYVTEGSGILRSIKVTVGRKTPPAPKTLDGEKGNIYLERRNGAENATADGSLWIYFNKPAPTPDQEHQKLLYYFDRYSISSAAGQLETPEQFAELTSTLESIKTFLKSSPVPAEPVLS